MARLHTSGGELGHYHPEGFTIGGAGPTTQTGTKRTGSYAFQTTQAANGTLRAAIAHVLEREYWLRAYVQFSTLSGLTANANLIFGTTGSDWIEARLFSNSGTPTIRITNSSAQQADWVYGVDIVASTWYCFELNYRYSGVGNAKAVLRIWNEDSSTLLQTITISTPTLASLPSGYFIGQDSGTAGGATMNIFYDDIALNDSTGSNQNSSPGAGKVYMLRPASDPGTSSANWTKPGGATTNKHTSLDNAVPVFETYDSTSASAEDYIRNAVSGATADLFINMQTYDDVIPSVDTITLVQPVVCNGVGTSGVNAGELAVASNPVIGTWAIGFTSGGVVSSTPTTWVYSPGDISYAPSVTRGNAPQIRVRKTTATTRPAIINSMGLMVEVIPGVAAAAARPVQRVIGVAPQRAATR